MIIGGGTSIRWDIAQKFDGPIISCDISASNTARFGGKIPTYIVTLEDGDTMHSMFDLEWKEKPPVVVSSRTKPDLKNYIQLKGFQIIHFEDEILRCCWNCGTMAWMFAWQKLGYDEIYLNGFDSLLSPDSLLEKLWYDSMRDYADYFAPKDLKTYIIPNRRFNPVDRNTDGYDKVTTIDQFVQYRMKRDEEFMKRLLGNLPEDFQPILF